MSLPTTDVADVTTGTVDLTKAGIAGGKITFTTSTLAGSLRFSKRGAWSCVGASACADMRRLHLVDGGHSGALSPNRQYLGSHPDSTDRVTVSTAH